MTKILAVVADLHVNSTVGLCPPELHTDQGQIIIPSKSQKWMWSKWLDFWRDAATLKKRYDAQLITLILGDWCDINRHSKAQLFEYEKYSDVLKWMLETAEPLCDVSDIKIAIRGTEAHTGGAGHLEETAAGSIGAMKDDDTGLSSFWTFERAIEGVKVFATHHPGTNSTVPWTLGNAANRAAVKTEVAFGDNPPDLAFFGHVHHSEDSADNHRVRAIFVPPWKLGDAFTYRIGAGWGAQEIGGILAVLENGRYQIAKRYTPLPTGSHRWATI